MTKPDKSGETRFERPDLRKEYRPIGIGAVAAALSATGKDQDNVRRDGRNTGEEPRADNDPGRHRSFLAA